VSDARPITAHALRAMLGEGGELALIDLREELPYSQGHLLWARSVPLSRLELRFPRLVPRRSTPIVLCDNGNGLVNDAASVLAAGGYDTVCYLDGGVAGWALAGFELFSGMHVPSKAFGEFVEHACNTPGIDARELDALMRADADLVVLDSRPFDEYTRVSIPAGINVPGAELVLRARELAPSPATTIVVNCAGRTRSIIGAQSLIDAGVPNTVMALRNGTMGWHLAGLTCDSGRTERAPPASEPGLAWARTRAQAVAERYGVACIDRAALARLRADGTRTTYLFDVRDPAEYAAGHLPGAVSAPGGQLVQATDLYAGTLGARIVVCDDKAVRALMTASWLRRMGWQDVFVLPEAGDETGMPEPEVLGAPPAEAAIEAEALGALLGQGEAVVIDLARSPDYRRGHIPGAWFAIRTRLRRALETIAPRGTLVLTSEDGILAGLAVAEAAAITGAQPRWLRGGTAAWRAAGLPLSTEERMADEPVDAWLKPYERPGDTEAAMNAYLSWEVDLLAQIARDGTCRFQA
jgi:rhodanese-related sulfurtransferase